MARKSKQQAPKKPKLSATQEHAAALNKHANALNNHAAAMTSAASVHIAISALKNNTAAVAASKPQKTFNQKTADAADCIGVQWLVSAKGVSAINSRVLTKNMAGDFRIGSPQEMQLCLEAVQICMSSKGDFYHLDTTSPNANTHLNSLVTGTLGQVIADIVKNTI